MDSYRPQQKDLRQRFAVACWTILCLFLLLDRVQLSPPIAGILILLISLSSAGSLYLFNGKNGSQRRDLRWDPALFVASLIPLVWAILVSQSGPAGLRILLPILAVSPSLLVGMPIPKGALHWGVSERKMIQEIPVPTSLDRPPDAIHNTESVTQDVAVPETSQMDTTIRPFVPCDGLLPELDAAEFSHLTQWMTRTVVDSEESISGGVRVDFREGEREVTVHLAFCPAFLSTPRIEVEDLDGVDLTIRVAAIFPFGARLLVRRSDTSATVGAISNPTCRVGFQAVASQIRRAA